MNGLRTAWRLLSWIPVAGEDEAAPRTISLALPAAGAVLGGILWITVLILQQLGGNLAAALLGAVLLPAVYLILTAGRNMQGLIEVLEGQVSRHSLPEHSVYWSVLGFLMTITIRALFCAGLVYADAGWWLLLPPVLSAAVYADLRLTFAGSERQDSERKPEAAALPIPNYWALALLVCLFAGIRANALPAALFALIAAWLLSLAAPALAVRFNIKVSGALVRTVMEITELAVMAVGLLMLIY